MSAIRGFIFDLDGVITETSEFHYQSWQRLADEEGLPFTREDNEQLRGVSRRESLMRLLKGKSLPEDTIEDYMYRKNAYYQEYLQTMSPDNCLQGVREFLAEAQSRNLKMGVGSASRNARPVLEKLELLDLFEVIGDGHSVVNGKPAPDLFVWVAGGLRISPRDIVVFEDAEAGITSAKTAGCKTIGVGSPDNVGEADKIVDGLHEITVAEVLTFFAD